MKDPFRFSKTQQWIFVKILSVVILLAIGFAFIGNGIILFTADIYPRTLHSFTHDLELHNEKSASINIVFQSNEYGIKEHRNIDTGITVYIPENSPNSTNVEIGFPRANIVIPETYDYILKEGKIVSLKYINTDSNNISHYNANPILLYFSPGTGYTTSVKISQENENIFEDEFETGLDVKSLDYYDAKKSEKNSQGLLFIVAGISIIASSNVAVKLVEVILEFRGASAPT